MTADTLQLTPGPDSDHDGPREISGGHTGADRAFNGVARGLGIFVLVLTGAIGLFLGLQMIPVLRHYGIHFITGQAWDPDLNVIGILAAIFGTVEIATIALLVSFPLAIGTALFITELAPRRLRSLLVSLVDLMAAVPSIVYGLWGLFLLEPHVIHLSRWLAEYFGWFPLFHVSTDAHSATWQESKFTSSAFIAGIVVAMMVTPLACAVMRGVFAQAPLGEREAALALGSTKWGVIRTVVLPFGRGGIIGGTMLGLGRALGETIAVLFIISFVYKINWHALQNGANTISALIANNFSAATSLQLKALEAAGFVLFLMTLVVNTIAGIIVSRSRSGAATEI
ncbi:MAG TPA: phosphate ABC transporter permease subunit PstC [Mycobacteriales bacterium]|nr:phosphate ABC transporter permease subunit PstC [Mycobacteriales bacterium]